jgi:hypothetical protein
MSLYRYSRYPPNDENLDFQPRGRHYPTQPGGEPSVFLVSKWARPLIPFHSNSDRDWMRLPKRPHNVMLRPSSLCPIPNVESL